MIVHNLKIKYIYAKKVVSGNKSFELRKDDRNFREGDYIAFEIVGLPCLPGIDTYSKKIDLEVNTIVKFFDNHIFKITYMVEAHIDNGLQAGYCVLGFKPIPLDKNIENTQEIR